MYVNGQFGSTNVAAGSGTEQFLPSQALGGSLMSNSTAPGGTDFDSFSVLLSEGQTSAESLAMIAADASVVVFEADLTSAQQAGSGWSVSFGARTFSGGSTLAIEFSSDGVNFTPVMQLNLNTVDTAFDVVLGAAQTSKAYVRMTFDPTDPNNPLIDNVAINAAELVPVPEPSAALLGSVGLVGLAMAGRRWRLARD
jgi:hypothetical protein